MSDTVRPTKKQRELLNFIERFIGEHGYSPSYREIMNGLNYTSVATVALHVNNLIKRGHLRKREHSARSLEVTSPTGVASEENAVPSEEKWLLDKVEKLVTDAEKTDGTDLTEALIGQLATVIDALGILGMTEAAETFTVRIRALRDRLSL